MVRHLYSIVMNNIFIIFFFPCLLVEEYRESAAFCHHLHGYEKFEICLLFGLDLIHFPAPPPGIRMQTDPHHSVTLFKLHCFTTSIYLRTVNVLQPLFGFFYSEPGNNLWKRKADAAFQMKNITVRQL